MSRTDYTTISIEPGLRDRLRARKRGQESYSDLIKRLLEQEAREV